MGNNSNNKYYTSIEHMLEVFDGTSRKLAFKAESIKDFEEWKKSTRMQLAAIIGIDRMRKCSLDPQLIETVPMDGYRRDKMLIQTEKDVWMPFYLLIPDGINEGEKRPCMIAPHGHSSGGKYATAGRTDIPAIKEMIECYNYDYGVRYVKEGYITFCPDARGFGERRELVNQSDEDESLLGSSCHVLNHMAIPLGLSVTGMWTWDLMRLIDYIEMRSDCDKDRIGCGGLSGGGLQTLWLAAMDERIKCAVVSGYFYGYKDSLLIVNVNCSCNYVPHLWEYVDMGDIGVLAAPRALLIESGTEDNLNGERGLDNVTGQVEITRNAYRLFNAEDKLYHHVFKGEHMWNGEKTYKFIKGNL